MNIIISSLNPIALKITQMEITDFDSAKLWVHTSLNLQDIDLTLVFEGQFFYPLTIIKDASLNKNNYNGYRLMSEASLGNGIYSLMINQVLTDYNISISAEESLIDEHEPVYIIGRYINPIKTQIVEQDVNSQQIRFYIKKKYDGISFLDNSKKIFVDFIPVDGKYTLPDGSLTDIAGPTPFLSDEITIDNIIELEKAPQGQVGEWLCLIWNLPYDAMRKAGTVKFDVSVIDESEETRAYTWQTLPSSYAVLPNLGFRSALVHVPEIENSMAQLTRDVRDIETMLGMQSDDDPNNDSTITICANY